MATAVNRAMRDVAGRRLDRLAGARGNPVDIERAAQLEHAVVAWGPLAAGRRCGPAQSPAPFAKPSPA